MRTSRRTALRSGLILPTMQVEGWEHLPKRTEAAVYIANHQSFLVCSLELLRQCPSW